MNNTIISEHSTKPSVVKEFEPSKQPAPIIGRSEINNMTNSNSGWLASMSSMTKLLLLSLIASFAFGAYTFWNGNNDVPSAEHNADSVAITLAADSLKPSLNLDVNRLSQLGIESPGQIASIPIREIRVGMRVPAHNPEVSEQERSSWLNEIKPETWRTFTLDVEKQDGSGAVSVTLLRPSSWLVAETKTTNLALLELAVENAATEWAQAPVWANAIDEVVNSVTADAFMDRLATGIGWCKKTWQFASIGNVGLGVVNLGLSDLRSSVSEKISYELAIWEATVDVQSGAGVDSEIWLDMPELGVVGFATVVKNEPCPPALSGPGQVVTATFVYESAEILDLSFTASGRFSDDVRLFPTGIRSTSSSRHQTQDSSLSLGVTPAHPFWSVTRDKFIPAGELQQFEEVVTIDGQIWRLTSITARAGPESVYNFEVAGEHVYYVGRDGLLVHNIYLMDGLKKISDSSYVNALRKAGKTISPVQAKRLGSKIHGHHIVMKGAFSRSSKMRKVLEESRAILQRSGIDSIHDIANMTFAKNGDHSLAYASSVLAKLKEGEKLGDVRGALADIAKWLKTEDKVFRFGGV